MNDKIKILAIDDNNDNLISIKALVNESLPHAIVLTANNGLTGIEIAKKEDPDVVLLDIVMPGMDGFEVCKQLKTDKQLCDTPIVFVTAIKGDKISRIRALESGAEAFIAKPIDESELTAQIRAMVKIKNANTEKRNEKEKLAKLVSERTKQIEEELTERKLAEENVRRIENIQSKMIANISDVIVIINKNGFVKYKSPNITKLSGWNPDELIGIPALTNIHPDDLQKSNELISSIVQLYGSTKAIECRYKCKDGSYKWIEMTVINLLNDPDIAGILGSYHDITQRRIAEEKLKEHHDLLRIAGEKARLGGWTVNLDTNICYWSEVVAEIHEMPHDYSPNVEDGIKFYAPKWREIILNAFSDCVKNGIPYDVEVEIITTNGKRAWVRLAGEAVKDNTGKIFKIQGSFQDITDRKKIELELVMQSKIQEKLRETASKYINIPLTDVEKTIEESLEDLGRFVNADRVYIFEYDWNNNVCNNTHEWCNDGITPQIKQLQNCPLDDIPQWVEVHKAGQIMHIPNVFDLDITDAVRQLLEPQKIKSLITIPLMDKKQCIGFVGFDSVKKLHKYTEIEQGILTIFSQILLNIKSRKMMELNLIKAKEKAEESDRFKSAFIANISHEIRTPLTSIIGFSGYLTKPDLSIEKRKQFNQIINNSGIQLISLINDLLDISSIETNQIKIINKPTNISETLDELELVFKVKASTKNLEVRFIRGNQFINVITDNIRLRQILNNLISNALKYTSKGKIEFGYSIKNDFIEFFVSDTGIGIAPEMHEKIFDRFTQVETELSRITGGIGIGLSISKALVNLLGGKIWLRSALGNGSTFYFTIPYNKVANEISDIGNFIGRKTKEITILVADDNNSVLLYLSELLADLNINTILVRNGLEAIQEVNENQNIDMILMDINMPVMDGLEATRRIKKIRPDIPIIVQTAHVQSSDTKDATNAGCNGYITKPIMEEDFLKILHKFIEL